MQTKWTKRLLEALRIAGLHTWVPAGRLPTTLGVAVIASAAVLEPTMINPKHPYDTDVRIKSAIEKIARCGFVS